MKQIAAAALALIVTSSPVLAEEEPSLMERGAKLFLEGLLNEMEPAMRELEGMADNIEPALRSFAQEMGPALQDLMDTVQDWSAYEPPVVLPNGDILLKRKPDMPTPDELPAPEKGEIDI